jgi:hypothetical protein
MSAPQRFVPDPRVAAAIEFGLGLKGRPMDKDKSPESAHGLRPHQVCRPPFHRHPTAAALSGYRSEGGWVCDESGPLYFFDGTGERSVSALATGMTSSIG